jgi:hypothetical protein
MAPGSTSASASALEHDAIEAARAEVARLKASQGDTALLKAAQAEVAGLEAARDARAQLDADAKAAHAAAVQAYAVAQAHTATAALHAQAIAVSNIKLAIPIVLDLASTHYTKWNALFLNMLGKYELTDHVLVDVNDDTAADPYWARMDCTVKSWIFSTITPELMDVVHTGVPLARWSKVTNHNLIVNIICQVFTMTAGAKYEFLATRERRRFESITPAG